MTRALFAAAFATMAIGACGSSTTSSSGGGTSPAGSTSAPAGSSSSSSATTSSSTASGSGGMLTVTGSLSLSMQQTTNSASKCTTTGGFVSGILTFDLYNLQFSIPSGTTVFPVPAGKPGAGAAFYNNNDSTQEWSIGTRVSSAATGTVTLSSDGKLGTVDVDMLPDTPRPNPSLQPIHVKGTFVCP